MRLSLRSLGCSVATLSAIACSGTTVTQSERVGQGGSAGAALTSAAGYGSTGGSIAMGGADSVGGSNSVTLPNGGQPAIGGNSANAAGSVGTPTGGSNVGGSNAGGSSTAASTAAAGASPTGGTPATGGTSTTLAPPSISNISPASGIVTTTVAIAGKNFGATQGQSTVKIAGNAVAPIYWSDTSIEVAIPRTQFPGSTSIVVSVGAAQSNSSTFEVMLPRTVYINRSAEPTNAVAAFSLAANGIFTELSGSPYATGDELNISTPIDATSIAFNRATRRIFAISHGSIMVFDIDPVSGQLAGVSNGPFSSGAAYGHGIAVNASGTLVYATSSYAANGTTAQPSISAFTVSAAGSLTPVSGSPYRHSGMGSGSPALLHDDQLLVVNNERDMGPDFNALIVHRVDPTTGVLTAVTGSPFQIGLNAGSGHTDPSGTWYYLADRLTAAALAGYALLNSTGAPVALAGTPVAMNTTSPRANGMAFTPDGAYLYVGVRDGNQVSGFSLNAGTPTHLPGSPFTLDGLSSITTLAVSRNGSQLVIADGVNSSLMVHSLSAAGIPTGSGNGGSFTSVGTATGMVIAE